MREVTMSVRAVWVTEKLPVTKQPERVRES
jgi:hypothetical protein